MNKILEQSLKFEALWSMTTVKAGFNFTLKSILETYCFNDRKTKMLIFKT